MLNGRFILALAFAVFSGAAPLAARAASGCDEEKLRYAIRMGVNCSDLGSRLEFDSSPQSNLRPIYPAGAAPAGALDRLQVKTTADAIAEQGVAAQEYANGTKTQEEPKVLIAPSKPVMTYIVRQIRPGFINFTASARGILGSIISVDPGDEFVEKNNIQNPSNEIALRLATVYANSHGYTLSKTPVVVNASSPYASIRTVDGITDAQYVLDVTPPTMGFIYFPLDWTHYKLSFAAQAKITDLRSKRVVDRAGCLLMDADKAKAPNRGQIFADGGSVLKMMINSRSEQCVESLKRSMKL